MPGGSRKNPPHKSEFIAPTDAYPSQKKAYQYIKSLKRYLKTIYSNVKAV